MLKTVMYNTVNYSTTPKETTRRLKAAVYNLNIFNKIMKSEHEKPSRENSGRNEKWREANQYIMDVFI